MRPKALVSWSSGKDSAYALWETRRRGELEVVGLITTISAKFGRVSMHGVREELLDRQAAALGLPARKIPIPTPCPDHVYATEMARVMAEAKAAGVSHVVFGDLFLEDVRTYREARLAEAGMLADFPLWGRETRALARAMLEDGLEAIVTCIDPRKLAHSFAGRRFDARLLDDLPADVDACGERGEFHTFVTRAPSFSHPIDVSVGEVVERDGFVFADVLPSARLDASRD